VCNPTKVSTMTFRANEAMKAGYERARRFLVQGSAHDQRGKADEKLLELIDIYGPVVDAYPVWHPLMPQIWPGERITRPEDGYTYGPLDNTILFAHAFVTCTYSSTGNGEEIIKAVAKREAVNALKKHPRASIIAERLDTNFRDSTPILVTCQWNSNVAWESSAPVPSMKLETCFVSPPLSGPSWLLDDALLWEEIPAKAVKRTFYHKEASFQPRPTDVFPGLIIPTNVAISLMLENELWDVRRRACMFYGPPVHRESWQLQRQYMLGEPCGARSSLFVGPDTGKVLQRMYNSLLDAGVYGYGPIHD
jgi:hypothetical protein